jgi:hypothetical protein
VSVPKENKRTHQVKVKEDIEKSNKDTYTKKHLLQRSPYIIEIEDIEVISFAPLFLHPLIRRLLTRQVGQKKRRPPPHFL